MTFRSTSILKQLVGGLVGIGIALTLYTAVNFVSSDQRAFLLRPSSPQATENIDRMRFSDKNVDDATVRKIAYRAKTLAGALAEQSSSAPEMTTAAPSEAQVVSALVDARRDMRMENKTMQPSFAAEVDLPEEESISVKMEQSPHLSQSGIELWLIVGIAGAMAGITLSRRGSITVD